MPAARSDPPGAPAAATEQKDTRSAPRPGCLLGTAPLGGKPPFSGARFLSLAQRADAAGALLGAGMAPELHADLVATLRRSRDELPTIAVDAACGAAALGLSAAQSARRAQASLASPDRDEAAVALEVIEAALGLAADLGAQHVLLRLGPVRAVASRWDGLRRRFLRGELLEDETPAEQAMAARQAAGQDQLGACLRGLERVLNLAEARGLTVLLPNPRRALDFPSALELRVLLEELRGAPLAPLLDLPAAHLASTMRLCPLRETIAAFGAGPLALLGDACGAVGALPPGRGEVRVAAVARALPKDTRFAFVPWSALREEEILEGYRAVSALGA